MSVYVNEYKDFAKFYETSIICTIKNRNDFVPLLDVLNNFGDVKVVKNIHLKLYDIFSQTIASFTQEVCPRVQEWLDERGISYHPYKPLPYDVILPQHYEAKNIINEIFPTNFLIKENIDIKIVTNKVVITFALTKDQKASYQKIISSLNDIYGNKRSINTSIVIGYVTNENLNISKTRLEILKSLIPQRIYVNSPDVYHFTNVDTYHLYSENMF